MLTGILSLALNRSDALGVSSSGALPETKQKN